MSRLQPLSEPLKRRTLLWIYFLHWILQALSISGATQEAWHWHAMTKRCPCGKANPITDGNEQYMLCLGPDHAQTALCLLGECSHCSKMTPSTLSFRAMLCAAARGLRPPTLAPHYLTYASTPVRTPAPHLPFPPSQHIVTKIPLAAALHAVVDHVAYFPGSDGRDAPLLGSSIH